MKKIDEISTISNFEREKEEEIYSFTGSRTRF